MQALLEWIRDPHNIKHLAFLASFLGFVYNRQITSFIYRICRIISIPFKPFYSRLAANENLVDAAVSTKNKASKLSEIIFKIVASITLSICLAFLALGIGGIFWLIFPESFVAFLAGIVAALASFAYSMYRFLRKGKKSGQ